MIFCNLEIQWDRNSNHVVGIYTFGQPLVGRVITEVVEADVICEAKAASVMRAYAYKSTHLGIDDPITYTVLESGEVHQVLFPIAQEPA